MRSCLLSVLLLLHFAGFAQSFSFTCQKDTIVAGCNNSCITLKATVPDLYRSSSQYSVLPGNTPSGSCFQVAPVPPDNAGTSAGLTTDDVYSSAIDIGFPFQFFGTSYSQLVASSNGYVSFDITRAGLFSQYRILNDGGTLSALAGVPEDLPSTLYDGALIMGPYHDITPTPTTSPNRRITYTTIGTAPYRRWVLSFYQQPLFDCNASFENTHQIILNESTGIIQVLIYSKQVCTSWNDGRAMIGIQDMSKTTAVMVPGRRASDPQWTVTSTNNSTVPMESYSFIPTGNSGTSPAGTSLFKRVELYDMSNHLVSVGTSAPAANGLRSVSFPNVCTPLGTSSFIIRSVYQKNDDPNTEIFGMDTVRIVKNNSTPVPTATQVTVNCASPTATLTVNVNSGTGSSPFQYALNGGSFQNSNAFANTTPGNYVVTVKDALGCLANTTTSVVLQNNLTVKTVNDTTICAGQSFTATAVSAATNFSWTPTIGITNPLTANPTLAPRITTSYIVTATQGPCVAKDTVNVSVYQGAQVNAGPDQTIIAGDVAQLNATSPNGGSYLWTPATGLDQANIANPHASPTQSMIYTVQVTTPQGCTASDALTLTVLPYCVQPMTAFTPNGDGINDLWVVTNGNCYKAITAEVFDRYGSKVYESKNYSNDWDGKYKGSPLPDGTYYFVITYQLINGRTVYQKGSVTILR